MNRKMTAAQFVAQIKATGRDPRPRGNKYGAEKTQVGAITFDSKKEAARYADLLNMQRAGLISDLKLQVPIPLEGRDGPLLSDAGRTLSYVADFTYKDADGTIVVEDSKGYRTRTFKLKKAILRGQGIHVVEV